MAIRGRYHTVCLSYLCRLVEGYIKCEVVVRRHRMRRQAEAAPAAEIAAAGCTVAVEAEAADLHAQQDHCSDQQRRRRNDAANAYQDHLMGKT